MLISMRRHFAFLLTYLILPFTLQAHDLVDIQIYQPKICVDFRYASPCNYLGFPLYPFPRIYVDRFVAHRLGRVLYDLGKGG